MCPRTSEIFLRDYLKSLDTVIPLFNYVGTCAFLSLEFQIHILIIEPDDGNIIHEAAMKPGDETFIFVIFKTFYGWLTFQNVYFSLVPSFQNERRVGISVLASLHWVGKRRP